MKERIKSILEKNIFMGNKEIIKSNKLKNIQINSIMKIINIKTRLLIAMVFAMMINLNSNQLVAQILVERNGKVHVGPRMNNTDLGDVLSMSIMGKIDPYKSGAKLSFGDFGQKINNGWNVFVGEYGTTDTDKLWLHGKRGFYLTAHNGDAVLAYCDYYNGGNIVFKSGIVANELYVSCDPKLMKKAQEIEAPLEKLLSLESVGFIYSYTEDYERVPGSDYTKMKECTSEKEILDSIAYAKRLEMNKKGKQKYGFTFETIEKNFPELIAIDSNGYKYVNYTDLIPVLIAAIQMQQRTLDRQNVLLEEQANQLSLFSSTYRIDANDSISAKSVLRTSLQDNPILYQNSPNPFNSITTIEYYVPTSATSATLYVFDLQGNSKLTLPIETFGNGSVNISAQALSAGMYVYTLVVNNNIVDSKRMILTE